jgi:hypothetical protein
MITNQEESNWLWWVVTDNGYNFFKAFKMFPLWDANSEKIGSLDGESRRTRGWRWAATVPQGVTLRWDWPRCPFRLHVIIFINYIFHLLHLFIFRAFHSGIDAHTPSSPKVSNFIFDLPTISAKWPVRLHNSCPPVDDIPHSAVLSVEQPQQEPYRPPEDGECELEFFFPSHVPSHQYSATISEIPSANKVHPHSQTLEIQP